MEPITLADGRVISAIDENELASDLFFAVQEKVQKNGSANAQRWFFLQLFLVDGEPLSLDQLTEKPPVGLGVRAIARMNKYANEMLTEVPDPKA